MYHVLPTVYIGRHIYIYVYMYHVSPKKQYNITMRVHNFKLKILLAELKIGNNYVKWGYTRQMFTKKYQKYYKPNRITNCPCDIATYT